VAPHAHFFGRKILFWLQDRVDALPRFGVDRFFSQWAKRMKIVPFCCESAPNGEWIPVCWHNLTFLCACSNLEPCPVIDAIHFVSFLEHTVTNVLSQFFQKKRKSFLAKLPELPRIGSAKAF
jgi:hypothetical protein